MPLTELDLRRLDEALQLAEGAIGLSDPNPRVGCILGRADGSVMGQGHTQAAGNGHAEVEALRNAHERGESVAGATAWVTLEPCAHHGRTPPCVDALVAAGISRVVVGALDPFPAVNGQGIARLRAAGLTVDLAPADFGHRARDLNIGFFHRVRTGLPWVRMKMAASLDGRTALPDGRSQWITSAAARADGHSWRRRAGAVLTGIGTVLADNPRLDVRDVPTARQPCRVVIDTRGRLPATARVFDSPGDVRVYSGSNAPAAFVEQARTRDGLSWQPMPTTTSGVDLAAVVADLGRRGFNELHVEAGPTLSGAFWTAGLVDELLLYVAPLVIGPGRPLLDLPTLPDLTSGKRLQWVEHTAVGPDLRCRLRLVDPQ